MIVSIKKNKYQIIISIVIGSLYYFITKNEKNSMVITLLSVIILRFIKIDKILDKN